LTNLLAAMADEILEPAESTVLKRNIESALRFYQGRRFAFAEKSGTFSTVAGTSTYTAGVGGVPTDLLIPDIVRMTINSRKVPLNKVSIAELRERQNGVAVNSDPYAWAWFADALQLYPTPAAVRTVNLDYLFDCTRDEGAEGAFNPSSSSGDFTNAFFKRGEELLRSRALMSYAAGRGNDQQLFMRMRALNQLAESSLGLQFASNQLGGMQMRPNL
jgi:hypothetical protein